MMVNIAYLASVMLITFAVRILCRLVSPLQLSLKLHLYFRSSLTHCPIAQTGQPNIQSYSHATQLGVHINSLCKPLHPKKLARDAHGYAASVVTNASNDDVAAILRMEMEFDRETAQANREKEKRNAETNNNELAGSSVHKDENSNCISEGVDWDSYRSLLVPVLSEHKSLHREKAPASDCVDIENGDCPPHHCKHGCQQEQKPVPIKADGSNNNKSMEENINPSDCDWIGRWFIVPSYVVVLISLLVGGWGFKK